MPQGMIFTSSTSACLCGLNFKLLLGFGSYSSLVAVWRGSKCSPEASLVLGKPELASLTMFPVVVGPVDEDIFDLIWTNLCLYTGRIVKLYEAVGLRKKTLTLLDEI